MKTIIVLENTLEVKDTYVLSVFGLSRDIGQAPKVNGEFVRENSAIFFPDFPFYFLPTQEAVYEMELVLKEKESVQDIDENSTAHFFEPEDSEITKTERANFVNLLKSNTFIFNSSGTFCCAIEDDGNTWSVYRLENGELKIKTESYWMPRSISVNNLSIIHFPDALFSPKKHQGDSAWGMLPDAPSGKIVFRQHRHLKFSAPLGKVLQHLADICQENVGVLNVVHREGTALVFVGTSLVATAESSGALCFQPDFWKSSWAIDFLWDAQTIAMLSNDTYNQIAWIFVEDGEEERSWFSTIWCNELYYQRIQDDSEIFAAVCARWIEQLKERRIRSGQANRSN